MDSISDIRADSNYYQSFVELANETNGRRWLHMHAVLDGDTFYLSSARGVPSKEDKRKAKKKGDVVAKLTKYSDVSRTQRKVREFGLRMTKMTVEDESMVDGVKTISIVFGCENEINMAYWETAISSALARLRYGNKNVIYDDVTSNSTSPDAMICTTFVEPPPLPPRDKTDEGVSVDKVKTLKRIGSKANKLLGQHDSINTLKAQSQDVINADIERVAGKLALYAHGTNRIRTSLGAGVATPGRHWNHISTTPIEYAEPYGEIARNVGNDTILQYSMLIRGSNWPTLNGGSLGSLPMSTSFFGLRKQGRQQKSRDKNRACRVKVYVNSTKEPDVWTFVTATTRVPLVAKADTGLELTDAMQPCFPTSLLLEIPEKDVMSRKTRLRFHVHSEDSDGHNSFVMARFEMNALDVLSYNPLIERSIGSTHWAGKLLVTILRPQFTRRSMVPLTRPMRQTYRLKQEHGGAADDDGNFTTTMLIKEEVAETPLSFLVPALYLRMRGEEMKRIVLAKSENIRRGSQDMPSLREKSIQQEDPRAESKAELMKTMKKRVQEDYIDAAGTYMRRFLCNESFRSSKQKKDPLIKAVPVNFHIQTMTVRGAASRSTPLPRRASSDHPSYSMHKVNSFKMSTADVRAVFKREHGHEEEHKDVRREDPRRFSSKGIDSKTYEFITWGAPASHTDKFKNGHGTWHSRQNIHKTDQKIRTMLTKVAETDMKDSELNMMHNAIKSKISRLKTSLDTVNEREKKFAAIVDKLGKDMNLDVEIGSDFRVSLQGIMDIASTKNETTRTVSVADVDFPSPPPTPGTTKPDDVAVDDVAVDDPQTDNLDADACRQILEKCTSDRMRFSRELHDAMSEETHLARQMRSLTMERASLRQRVNTTTAKMEREILMTQLRHDTAMCHALSAATVGFMLEIERVVREKDSRAMERLASVGFLMHQESLLSSYDKEEGMLEDQLSTAFALDGVVFSLRRVDRVATTRGQVRESVRLRRLASPFDVHVFTSKKGDKSRRRRSETFDVLGGLVMERYLSSDASVKSTPFTFTLPKAFDLCLEPLRQVEIEVAVPALIYDRLPSSLTGVRCKDDVDESSALEPRRPLVRVRSLLFAQGINEAQDLQNFKHDIEIQRLANRQSFLRLEDFIKDIEALPRRAHPINLRQARLALEDLRAAVDSGEGDYAKHFEILILSADIARMLKGSRLTNCMSGKDRTGMSVTLEQARILARHHRLHRDIDASWTRITMLHTMLCGLRIKDWRQYFCSGSSVYLKISLHLPSGLVTKYTPEIQVDSVKKGAPLAWPTFSVPFRMSLRDYSNETIHFDVQLKEKTKGMLRANKRVVALASLTLRDVMPSIAEANNMAASLAEDVSNLSSSVSSARTPHHAVARDVSLELAMGDGNKMLHLTASGIFTKVTEDTRHVDDVVGPPVVLDVASMMRRDGVRIHNCRKNVGKAKYSLNNITLMVLPKCYVPPEKASGKVER